MGTILGFLGGILIGTAIGRIQMKYRAGDTMMEGRRRYRR